MRELIILIMIGCIFSSTTFAGKYDDLGVYFPTAPGTTWTYQIANLPPEWQVRIVECSPGEDGIKECLVDDYMVPGVAPKKNIYVIQGDTVLNRATKALLQDWRRHTPAEIVLRSPLKLGTTWQNVDNSSNGSKDDFKIVGIEKISVKSGDYDNVIKILRNRYNKDDKTNKWELANSVYMYYAPNVGLIKEVILKKGKVPLVFRELVEIKYPE